jgi:hypothetical protein
MGRWASDSSKWKMLGAENIKNSALLTTTDCAGSNKIICEVCALRHYANFTIPKITIMTKGQKHK